MAVGTASVDVPPTFGLIALEGDQPGGRSGPLSVRQMQRSGLVN
jgi:hypothetical protein